MQLFETEWFHPPSAPEDVAFEIRALSFAEGNARRQMNDDERSGYLLEKGTVGWRGIVDMNGHPAPVTAENIGALPDLMALQVVGAIADKTYVTEDVGKNLESPSPSGRVKRKATSTAKRAPTNSTATNETQPLNPSGPSPA